MINDAVKSLRAKNLRQSMSSTEKHSASAISHSRIAKNLARNTTGKELSQ
jgi:hypothetical protein